MNLLVYNARNRVFMGKGGSPLLVDVVPPGGELWTYHTPTEGRTYSGTYAVVNKAAKDKKRADGSASSEVGQAGKANARAGVPEARADAGGPGTSPLSNRKRLSTPGNATAATPPPPSPAAASTSSRAASASSPGPSNTFSPGKGKMADDPIVGQREFKWYFPQREGGKHFWTMLHGADGKIELYDKTGTVRKQYNAKKTMPRHTLRLSDCLALAEGKTPGKGAPCIMLTFKSKGTVCMATTKEGVLQEWLGLLHDHWNGDGSSTGGGSGGNAAAAAGVVLAKFAFQATIKGQLSIARGEAVTVINKVAAGGGRWEESSKGWVCVKNSGGKQGDVPSAYLEAGDNAATAPLLPTRNGAGGP